MFPYGTDWRDSQRRTSRGLISKEHWTVDELSSCLRAPISWTMTSDPYEAAILMIQLNRIEHFGASMNGSVGEP
jgi:hypothetical protein